MFLFILNYIIILLSIVIFISPFFVIYALKHKQSISGISFNYYLEKFFSSEQSNWLIFTWAASEALFWFVIPEFLLLLVVFMRIRRKRQMLLYDISGTVVGTIFALLLRLPDNIIVKFPYIQEKMISQTKSWYDEQGLFGLVHQPFSGVPYKVFTNVAWQYKYSLILFIIYAVIVRLFRYLIAYGLFISLYPKLHKLVRNNYLYLALGAIFIFSILLLKTYRIYS